jgi:hypothetical protein
MVAVYVYMETLSTAISRRVVRRIVPALVPIRTFIPTQTTELPQSS